MRTTLLRCLRTPSALSLACAGVVALPAGAQDVVAARDGTFRPSIAAEGSYLETRSRPDSTNGHEAVMRLSPGLHWTSRTGRIQGEADYLGDLLFRRGRSSTEGSDYQNALNARVLAEAVPNRVGVEANASVTQQAISAFGEQAVPGAVPPDANRTEVSTVRVSPYARGHLGSAADYEMNLAAGRSHTRSGDTPDSRTTEARFSLSGPRGARLGWNVTASQQRVESISPAVTDASENIRLRLALTAAPMPQLRLSVSGGEESIDEGALAKRRTEKNAGVGLQWSPSLRTQLSADIERRHFGNGGRINFSHRGPQTVLTYAFSRDTTFGIDGTAGGAPATLFQLAFAQAASQYPDPVERELAVLADLLSRGLDPNQVVTVPVLGPAFSLQQRQDLSFAWLGRRTSLNVAAFTSWTSQFVARPNDTPLADDPVRQRGYSATLSYRLTPFSALSLGGQRRMTQASTHGAANDLKSADLGLTSQLGRRTTARVDVRYSVFNSPTDPYRTTSVSASISERF